MGPQNNENNGSTNADVDKSCPAPEAAAVSGRESNNGQAPTSRAKVIGRTIYKRFSAHVGLFLLPLLLVYTLVGAAVVMAIEQSSTYRTWTFWESMVFCGTVYTTIGYGNLYTTTNLGRVFTMFYASFGIPLFFIVMADVGKLLMRGLKFIWSKIQRSLKKGSCNRQPRTTHSNIDTVALSASDQHGETEDADLEQDDETTTRNGKINTADEMGDGCNLLPLFAILIVIIYIALGAIFYTYTEKWTYLESFYFIYASISTIGFGDLVPVMRELSIALSVLSALYILFGIALMAMLVTVLIDAVQRIKRQITETLEPVTTPRPTDNLSV